MDLARPETATGRDELGFLVGSAVFIIGISALNDPPTAVEMVLIAPAFVAFVLRGLLPRLPAEVFAAAVVGPVVLVVGREGHLEGTFFLTVLVVLYAAWQLGSTTRALVILAVTAAAPWVVAHVLAPDSDIGWAAWTSTCFFTFAMGKGLRRQQLLIEELKGHGRPWPSRRWPRSGVGSRASSTTSPATRWPPCSCT